MSTDVRPYDDSERADAAALAAKFGLRRVGARPPIGEYVKQIWSRRHFLWSLASAKSWSRNQNNYLGQVWSVLNPLLLATVYFIVFGQILDTRGNVDNFVGFLVIGIFMFQFLASSINAGAGSINGNISLVRALRFPRAVLPFSVTLAELLNLVPALVVMLVIVLLTGEPPTVKWLLLPVAVVLMTMFNTGCALIAARLVVGARDLRNLIPVGVRLLRYVSGVFFPIAHYTGDGIGGALLQYQPVAVYIDMVRQCLLTEGNQFDFRPSLWWAGLAWAVGLLAIGFVVFWRAEERYGRD